MTRRKHGVNTCLGPQTPLRPASDFQPGDEAVGRQGAGVYVVEKLARWKKLRKTGPAADWNEVLGIPPEELQAPGTRTKAQVAASRKAGLAAVRRGVLLRKRSLAARPSIFNKYF